MKFKVFESSNKDVKKFVFEWKENKAIAAKQFFIDITTILIEL